MFGKVVKCFRTSFTVLVIKEEATYFYKLTNFIYFHITIKAPCVSV